MHLEASEAGSERSAGLLLCDCVAFPSEIAKMAPTLILIRHAQGEHNVSDLKPNDKSPVSLLHALA
jgi:hypothetical protein